jgi:RNA polymerase sigma-70 factor (ECF subfamily)
MHAIDVGLTGVNGDAEFLRRLAARKPDATARFSKEFPRVLGAIVRVRVSGRSLDFVEDVVQDTLRAVLEAVDAGKVREPEHFGSFVMGVCENTLRRHLHERGRHPLTATDAPEPMAGDNPEAQTSAREDLEAVAEALGSLAPRDRSLLEQMLLVGTDKEEICRQFGVTREHLRVLFHRAKGRFKEALARQGTRGASGL